MLFRLFHLLGVLFNLLLITNKVLRACLIKCHLRGASLGQRWPEILCNVLHFYGAVRLLGLSERVLAEGRLSRSVKEFLLELLSIFFLETGWTLLTLVRVGK